MHTPRRITAGNEPSRNQKPIASSPAASNQWGVSFEYFSQTENFGLGDAPSKWFMSMLNSLSKLNKIPLDDFIKLPTWIKANRYHKINWGQPKIPIQRHEFTWVKKAILDNEEEFPFYQFQISQSLGRVVGFWNSSHNLFHIVLLDYAHNIQPTKGRGYSVDKTTILDCEYTMMTTGIAQIIEKYEKDDTFKEITYSLRALPTAFTERKLIYLSLDDDYIQTLEDRIGERTIKDVLELGITSLL